MPVSSDLWSSPRLSGPIAHWRDFSDRVSAGMAVAASQGGDLLMTDPDFAAWPLGLRTVSEAFDRWVRVAGQARCTVLAAHFEVVPRRHPRWLAWRAKWGHRVRCLEAPPECASAVRPTFMVSGVLGLRLLEGRHGQGVWSRDPATLAAWRQEIDVILQRSHEAMPPTTLGL